MRQARRRHHQAGSRIGRSGTGCGQETGMPTEGVAGMSETYTARAVRWEHGWELHIEGEGVTQVRTLDKATDQIRDYLETMHERSFDDAEISVEADLGGVLAE